MERYEFLIEKNNQKRCCECPWKGRQCNNDQEICLVEAHQTITQKPFTPYNGITPFKME